MFAPDDPLAPIEPVFAEPWHAQVLAIADSMVKAGHFPAADWAEALGAELCAAEARGEADTADTYYRAALAALERLSATHADIPAEAQQDRKAAWERAYRNTPHGEPVLLSAGSAKP